MKEGKHEWELRVELLNVDTAEDEEEKNEEGEIEREFLYSVRKYSCWWSGVDHVNLKSIEHGSFW